MDHISRADAVAQTIRAERAARQLSQAETARKAEIPRISYIRYETGEREPTLTQVIKIASAFGLSPSAFIRRVEERQTG